jgi:hypothetical protein
MPLVHCSIREDISKRKSYYVRAGGLSTGLDVTLYDTANLYAITQGQGAATVIGELWVEYDVRLMTPRALSAGGGNAVWSRYSQGADNVTPVVYNAGNLPATFVSTGTTASLTTWTFTQPWQGSLSCFVAGTGLTTITLGGTAANSNLGTVVSSTGGTISARAELNVNQGQTVALTINNTTLASAGTAGFSFTQGFGAYQ